MGAFGLDGCLTDGRNAIVATGTTTGNTRMIKATVRLQCKKTGGIVAAIAFDDRRHMKIGFTEGQHTVMAFAAISKYFQVVNEGHAGESQRGMTAFAHIAGSDMVLRFAPNRNKIVAMAIHAA